MPEYKKNRTKQAAVKRKKKSGLFGYTLSVLLIVAGVVAYLNKEPLQKYFSKPERIRRDIENNLCEEDESVISPSIDRVWILKDSDLFSQYIVANYSLEIDRPKKDKVYYRVSNSNDYQQFNYEGDKYNFQISSENYEPGEYSVISYAYDKTVDCYHRSAPTSFKISYPLYVALTIDWEGYDVTDPNLAILDDLSEKYDMPLTHFFNPRIYLTNVVPEYRANFLTYWVKNRKAKRNDEIGLHLHMFYDLWENIGITPKKSPQWDNRGTGSDVPSTVYTYDEFKQLLDWSKRTFIENGLEEPKSFRAGGWFVNLEIMRAINDSGFLYDSSGREKYELGKNLVDGYWDLQPTTRPYQPSTSNINSSEPDPQFNIWEFPDNGLESWRFEASDLIARFDANYQGKPMTDKQVVTYLTHPHNMNLDVDRVYTTYDHVSKFKAADDNGPVVLVTLEQAHKEIVKSDS